MPVYQPEPGDTMLRQADGTPYPVTVSSAASAPYMIHAGSTFTFTVKLPVGPSEDVTVTGELMPSGFPAGLTLDSALTFTSSNFSSTQNFTVETTAGESGIANIMFSPSGTDVPGYNPVVVQLLVC
jgi:hypothetical protein